MKITPEAFVEANKEKSYEELLAIRDRLITVIQNFESDTEQDPEDVLTYPLPDGNYYCNLKLLGSLCNLIAERFGEEGSR